MAALGWLLNLDFAGGGTPAVTTMLDGGEIIRRERRTHGRYGYVYYVLGLLAWICS